MVFGFLKKQFIDVIEWDNQNDEVIAWRFPVADNEIKTGAQLTVREGQMAVFLNEGQIADVFKPGRHTLATQNLPILTTLGAWKHGFNSPFKADVVFISTRELRNFKWGTSQPIMLRDPDFGVVRVRAFGTFGVRVIDGKDFIRECAGVRDVYQKSDIEEVIRKVVVSKFTDALAEMKVGAIDMATHYEELGAEVNRRIARAFDNYGIELTSFTIESVNVPEEIQAAIDEQSKMNLMMNSGQRFAQWQTLKGIPDAMKGGGAGHGIATDIAVGQAMGKVVSQALDGALNAAQNTAPQAPAATSNGNQKFCQDCGARNARDAKFCQECGKKFE